MEGSDRALIGFLSLLVLCCLNVKFWCRRGESKTFKFSEPVVPVTKLTNHPMILLFKYVLPLQLSDPMHIGARLTVRTCESMFILRGHYEVILYRTKVIFE